MSEHAIRRVAVIGAGRMGTGIAQVCAMTGIPTVLIDRDPDTAARAQQTIQAALHRAVERARLSPVNRDRALASLRLGGFGDLGQVDLAIEAVPEAFDTKARLFAQLAEAAPRARPATNTRTLSVRALSQAAGRGDLVGLHFHDPVPRARLLEVVSDDAAWPALNEFAMRLGKIAVRSADSPGLIVDRVSQPLFLEAGRMRAEGLARRPNWTTAWRPRWAHRRARSSGSTSPAPT